MSQIAEAYVRVRPDFSGFRSDALNGAEKELKNLQTSVTDTEDAVKRAARENVTSSVTQKESLAKLHAEYADIARSAQKGSDVQVAANKLAAESARTLGRTYEETSAKARLWGRSASTAASETSKLERGALAGSGAMSHMVRSLAFASTAFIGAAGFTAALKSSVDEAARLQDQMNRTDVVFEKSAVGVQAWSKTAASAMGLSRSAALDAASTMGTLLKNIGETPPKAAATSTSLVKLAADMAAFKKVAPETALSALESALQGRTRSLKQFGIVIDNTSLKAQALDMGLLKGSVDMGKVRDAESAVGIAQEKLNAAIAKHGTTSVQAAAATLALHAAQQKLEKATSGATGTLTAQEKALATVGLVMKQTKEQQGAFARSGDELTIQQRRFHASLQDLEAEIGTKMLPALTHLTGEAANWVSKASSSKRLTDDLKQAVSILGDAFHVAAQFVKLAWGGLRDLSSALGGAKDTAIAFLAVFAANKLRAVAGDVIQLAMKVGLVGTTAVTAEGETVAAFAGMRVATIELGATIKGMLITTGIGAVIVAVGLLAGYVLTHWDQVKRYTEDLGRAMQGTFQAAWDGIKGIFYLGIYAVLVQFEALTRGAAAAFGWIPGIGGKIKHAMKEATGYIEGFRQKGLELLGKAGSEGGAAWSAAFNQQVQTGLVTADKSMQATLGAPDVSGAGPVGSSSLQARIIGTAVSQKGVPYQTGSTRAFGGAGALGKPTDCSGLVHNILAANGVSVPGTSQAQFAGGQDVSNQPLQPGDLLFWNNHLNEANGQPGHVTMYIGGGLMVEDPHTGASVQIVPVRSDGYMGARRYVGVTTKTPNTSTPGSGSTKPPPASTPTPAIPSYSSGATAKKPVGLLGEVGAINMREQLSALGDKTTGLVPGTLRSEVVAQIKVLTDAIHKGLGPEVVAGLRKDIGDIRTEIHDGLQLDKGIATTKVKLGELAATIRGFPGPLRASLEARMKEVRGELATATTPADLAHARSDLKKLSAAITDSKKEETALLKKYNAEQLATWKAHLRQMQAAVSASKTVFSNAWQDLADSIGSVFDRETQKHLDAMKATLDAKVASLDADLKAKLDEIDAANKVLTPAEKELKDLQDTKAEADRQKAITDATLKKSDAALKLTDAQRAATTAQQAYNDAVAAGPAAAELADAFQTRLADLQQKASDAAQASKDAAQAVVDAQVASDDALYNEKLATLQDTAAAQREAANAAAEQQKEAAQAAHDTQAKSLDDTYNNEQQNYQDLRSLQKREMDAKLSELETQLSQRGVAWDTANGLILDAMKQFGIDPTWFQSGNDAGSELLKGLEAAFAAAKPALAGYQEAADAAAKVAALKPVAPTTPADRTKAILDELVKQTAIAETAARQRENLALTVQVQAGNSTAFQVARDSLR